MKPELSLSVLCVIRKLDGLFLLKNSSKIIFVWLLLCTLLLSSIVSSTLEFIMETRMEVLPSPKASFICACLPVCDFAAHAKREATHKKNIRKAFFLIALRK